MTQCPCFLYSRQHKEIHPVQTKRTANPVAPAKDAISRRRDVQRSFRFRCMYFLFTVDFAMYARSTECAKMCRVKNA